MKDKETGLTGKLLENKSREELDLAWTITCMLYNQCKWWWPERRKLRKDKELIREAMANA